MGKLTPPVEPLHHQSQDKEKLLYNPANWPFYSFLLTPLIPAIFYNRNSKILGKPEEGKKILMLAWGSLILYLVLSFIFDFGRLFGFLFSLGWIVFFFQKSKEEKPMYAERKKNFPQAKRQKEWPVVLTAIIILVVIGILGATAELLIEPGYTNSSLMRYK